MNIRTAILKAADSIEQNPDLFNFLTTKIPDSCGTPGCAIGWVAFHKGCTNSSWRPSEAPNVAGHAVEFVGVDEAEFYNRMDDFNEIWQLNADNCADSLRLYANKYHPAKHTGIPDSVLAIVNQAGFMTKVQAE